MTPITLKPREINILVECGKVLLIRPLPPESQPPALCRYEINGNQSHALCLFDNHWRPGGIGFCPPTPTSTDHRMPCPFGPPGTPLDIEGSSGMVVRSVAIHRLQSTTASEAHAAGFHNQKSAIHMIDYEYDGDDMNPWCWFVMVDRDKGGKGQ